MRERTTSKQIIIEHLLVPGLLWALETQWQTKQSIWIVVLKSPVPCCLMGTEENSNHEASLSLFEVLGSKKETAPITIQ